MPEPPKPNFQIPSNENSNICHVIAIMSGKGGVGKSLVTSLLASRVSAAGYRVGILDAVSPAPRFRRPSAWTDRAFIPVRI